MKTKNIKFLSIAAAMVMTMVSCSSDYLEVAPKGTDLEANYYTNQTQAFAGLVAVYDVMRKNSGSFDNMITMMNSGSDDHYAGGGNSSDGLGLQRFSNYTMNQIDMPISFWSDHYQGIFRANVLLIKLVDVPMDANLKARYVAETKFLRANYYFNLVRMFKNIPLITAPLATSEYYTILQASPEAVYDQIEKDLTEAIAETNLPNTVVADDAGRVTKGAAHALLGKVYLYDSRNKKAQAAAQLALVNGTTLGGTNDFGYKLLSSYDNLWTVSNKFNTESILEVAHTSVSNAGWGNWANGDSEGNSVNVMVGPRTYVKIASDAPALPSGWSFNVITQSFYDVIKTDPRFSATVLDMKALSAAGKASYLAGYQDTGYFLNKFTPRQSDVTTGTGDAVLNYKQNTYVIRLADTYLMEAEALGGTGARAQSLLDAVRARVGLSPIPVTMAAIKAERRLELGGEGHRFFDLVRWGDAATALGAKVGGSFKPGTNEIFPIPYLELQNTKMVQNPGYIQ